MRSALPLSLPAALVLLACGPLESVDLSAAEPGTSASPIINGEICDAYGTESAVAILVDATVNFGGQSTDIKTVVCTGTLIAPDVVLTAAHCLDATALTLGFGEVEQERYFVTFEESLESLAQQETEEFPEDAVEAVAWATHEQFSMEGFGSEVNGPGEYFDIGAIFLSEAITDVAPEVVLTPEEGSVITEGGLVTIAGWGQQVQTSGPFEAPPEGTVGNKICAASFIGDVGETEFQVGGDATTSRKCHGDSGGPSYAEIEGTEHTRSRRVVGITSHAYDAEDCNKGGVDTRVDAYYGWLDGAMAAACADDTRVWCQVPGVIPASFYDPPPATGDADKDGDEGDEKVAPPPVCECVSAGDAELGPPSLALLLGGLVLLRRRRRR